MAAPPWPSSPRPSSPSLPPVRREKRENSQKQLRLGWPSGSPLSRPAVGRLGERGWGSEGLEAADRAPSTKSVSVTIQSSARKPAVASPAQIPSDHRTRERARES